MINEKCYQQVQASLAECVTVAAAIIISGDRELNPDDLTLLTDEIATGLA